MANKIQKNLSGPERWTQVDAIIAEPKSKQVKPTKFGAHDFATWTIKQKENYTTAITGIKPNQGTNRDKQAGRAKGRYIKGLI
jgi:hypothetical protein